jgi:anion-transporting  ArsA/GET3 family ATPase
MTSRPPAASPPPRRTRTSRASRSSRSQSRSAATSLAPLFAGREVLVTCGAGGVGKTTTAAALAARAAHELDARVVVLTIDPARRLADALGAGALSDQPTQVDPGALHDVGLGRGQLWAAMLDTKSGWDALIDRHAPDRATRDAMLANSVYDNISERFTQSHDYLAAERVHELHASGRFDLLIVDTPPAAHALDFFDAPARMTELFQGRLVKLLTVSSRNRVLTLASKPFYQVADRVLGRQLLGDLIEFFSLLQTMERGFVERAHEVSALLTSERTGFVVVTTTDAAPIREARELLIDLATRSLPVGAIIVNKVLPEALANPAAVNASRQLRGDADALAAQMSIKGASTADVASTLGALADTIDAFGSAARRGAAERSALIDLAAQSSSNGAVLAEIALLDGDLTNLAGLARIGDALWSSAR